MFQTPLSFSKKLKVNMLTELTQYFVYTVIFIKRNCFFNCVFYFHSISELLLSQLPRNHNKVTLWQVIQVVSLLLSYSGKTSK